MVTLASAAKPYARVRIGRALGMLLLLGGCADILGFSSSDNLVECNSDADCKPGFVCDSASRCRCERDCGEAGAGVGGTMATAGRGAGGSSGKNGTEAGEGGEGGSNPVGGHGAAAVSGGEAGVPEVGGSGGNGIEHQGGVAGDAFPAGAAGETSAGGAGAGAGPVCEEGDQTCFPCASNGEYEPDPNKDQVACGEVCHGDGVCGSARSCNSISPATCAGFDCCLSIPVPAGTFNQSCDYSCMSNDACVGANNEKVFPATLSAFSVDAFEVTVGRFRAFVAQYPLSKPAEKAGANTHNRLDHGWAGEWSDLLPADLGAKFDALKAGTDPDESCEVTWTSRETPADDRPMNCVTWYEAQAFCIWDGGRLPTEAEWNYVAAGGDDQRIYPWSSIEIDSERAVYGLHNATSVAIAPVGSLPAGHGRWFQNDLAGNVAEWTWDGYEDCRVPNCMDCGTTDGMKDKVIRGGAYSFTEDGVKVEARYQIDGGLRLPQAGFRCARDLP
jgi:sulfatase modifying factor 1